MVVREERKSRSGKTRGSAPDGLIARYIDFSVLIADSSADRGRSPGGRLELGLLHATARTPSVQSRLRVA